VPAVLKSPSTKVAQAILQLAKGAVDRRRVEALSGSHWA
jgi:hypothetical protein